MINIINIVIIYSYRCLISIEIVFLLPVGNKIIY